MSVFTKDASRIGTTSIEAVVRWQVDLADAEAVGNLGLEGRDEFSKVKTFRDVASAKAWCESYGPEAPGVVCDATVRSYEYDEETFEDAEYGTVVDGVSRELGAAYGSPGDDAWYWEDEGNL